MLPIHSLITFTLIRCSIYRTEPWITLTTHACTNFFTIQQGSSNFCKTQHVSKCSAEGSRILNMTTTITIITNKGERQPCPHGAHFKPDINRRNRQEAGTTRPSEDYWYHFIWMSWYLACTGVFSALKWSGAYRGGGACHPGHKVCLFVDQLKMVGIWETDSWQRKEQKRQRW